MPSLDPEARREANRRYFANRSPEKRARDYKKAYVLKKRRMQDPAYRQNRYRQEVLWRAKRAGIALTRPAPTTCECCGGPPNGRGLFHIDHNHVTGLFRGWICSNCNTGIGKLGDDLQGVLRAVEYLRKNDVC